jgi:hypothetical protein
MHTTMNGTPQAMTVNIKCIMVAELARLDRARTGSDGRGALVNPSNPLTL